jgi:hypothetical protein
VKRLFVAAPLAAYGAAVVLPATAIVGSDGAYAAGKTTKKEAGQEIQEAEEEGPYSNDVGSMSSCAE